MTRIFVSKEFMWDMAHMLACYDGLCKNLHGHTYRMQVEATGLKAGLKTAIDNSEHSMVIDLNKLKDIINEKIIEPLDHSFLYWTGSPDKAEHELAEVLKRHGRRVTHVEFRPTVEELAQDFLKKLNDEFEKYDILIKQVIVWETPTSFAKAILEDLR